ncbi:MAG: methyltransferase domain-containing protein [Gammaproteobacteria bacterium]|nr:methyltransferase domain-containing protein [Gammaproteobacteria bacterium]MCP5416607.1 methyltransferase domain-containing protein [Chromatiaceae bacterium]
MQDVDRELARKWDQRHASALGSGSVAGLLLENNHLLPRKGEALDLACGRGASALYLARRGMRVTAWDLSAVAIDRLQQSAREQGMTIACAVRDVIAFPPGPGSFDLILVSYFLERALAPAIIQALRPGGLLFFETFCVDAVSDSGPSNPAFRLGRNELLALFRPLEVVFYREEGRIGETRLGVRDIAQLVARKPPE